MPSIHEKDACRSEARALFEASRSHQPCWCRPWRQDTGGLRQVCKSAARDPQPSEVTHVAATKSLLSKALAERVGFEPTVRITAQRLSRPSRSTTPAPLRGAHVACRTARGNPSFSGKNPRSPSLFEVPKELTYRLWPLYCAAYRFHRGSARR